jgi:hypothetical protein
MPNKFRAAIGAALLTAAASAEPAMAVRPRGATQITPIYARRIGTPAVGSLHCTLLIPTKIASVNAVAVTTIRPFSAMSNPSTVVGQTYNNGSASFNLSSKITAIIPNRDRLPANKITNFAVRDLHWFHIDPGEQVSAYHTSTVLGEQGKVTMGVVLGASDGSNPAENACPTYTEPQQVVSRQDVSEAGNSFVRGFQRGVDIVFDILSNIPAPPIPVEWFFRT